MRSHLFTLLAALGYLMAGAGGSVQAQNPYARPGFIPPRTRPVLSPWLNLAAGGNPALNYFNGVLPQQQFNNQILQLQQGQAATQQQLSSLQSTSTLGQTGHPVQFMSYSQYFGNLGGTRPTAAGRSTAAASAPAAGGLGSGVGRSSLRTGSRIR